MYATLDTMKGLQTEAVLLQLADDDNDGVFVVSPPNRAYRNVTAAIAEAQTLVDSYLSARYSVPVAAPVPALVVQMTANLALCGLYDRKRELDLPEGIKERRSRYMALLKDIQAEKAAIPELAKPTSAAVLVNKTSGDRFFDDTLLNRM